METKADYHTGVSITKHLTVELVKKIDDSLAHLLKGKGWGEVTIVVEGHKIKWISVKESEPATSK